MADITSFKTPYRFLSNFWPSVVVLDDIECDTVEHAYQASKTLDAEQRMEIMNAPTPGEAKRLGRACTIRQDWEEVKIKIMDDLLRQKFANPGLMKRLKQTGSSQLIEGNTWGDTFWGVCKGKGANHLGKLLMRIRDER